MKTLTLTLFLAVVGCSSALTMPCIRSEGWAPQSIAQRGSEATGIFRGTLQAISGTSGMVTYTFQVTCVIKGLTGVVPSESVSILEYTPGRCGDAYDLLSNANTGDQFLIFAESSFMGYIFDRVNDEDAVFPGSESSFPCV